MPDNNRRVMLFLGVIFLFIAGAGLAVANMPPFQEWIAESAIAQSADGSSEAGDVRIGAWFIGGLFLVLALVFMGVTFIPAATSDSHEDLVRQAPAGASWNMDDDATVTTYTATVSGSSDEIADLVRDALAGARTAQGETNPPGSVEAQLAGLSRLHENGLLTAEEFAAAKKRLLGL